MKKQFLSLLAPGLMLGGTSQIKAMEVFLGIQVAAAAASHILHKQPLPEQPLPHFPDKISQGFSFNPDYRDVTTLPFIAGIRKTSDDKALIESTGVNPEVAVYFGARKGVVGYCVYRGTTRNSYFDLMKFIPSGHQPDDFLKAKASDLNHKITEILGQALKELECDIMYELSPVPLPDVKAAK